MSMPRHRTSCFASAVCAAAIVLAGCGNVGSDSEAAGGGDSEEILIAAIVDQTSYVKSLDDPLLAGAEAAAEEINANGGVDGKSIRIVAEDAAADPQKAVSALGKLQRSSPTAVLGGFSSAVTAAIAPQLTDAEIPTIVASVLPDDGLDFVFSSIIPVAYETSTRVEYLEQEGVGRVAILHDPSPYNLGQMAALEPQLDEAGIEVTGVAEHAPDTVDLRAQVAKILEGDPEAVIKLSAGPTQIIAARALEDAGADTPLLLGLESEETLQQAAEQYQPVLDVAAPLQVFDSLEDSQRNEAMTNLMESNPDIVDPAFAGRGWDAVHLIAEAIEEAGSLEGAELRDALIGMGPHDGTTAVYDFTEEDHNGLTSNPNYLAEISVDGRATAIFSPQR